MSPETMLPSDARYRWLYLDVAAGDVTVVVIFMLGAPFSPRYSVEARRGAPPLNHCAVNLAVYERGARLCWVLTEYPKAELSERESVRIGQSSWEYRKDGTAHVRVVDQTPWLGRPMEAELVLTPESPVGPELQLVEGVPHYWQPLAARARAKVTVKSLGLELEGRAYHDTNHGERLLGDGVEAWRWTRTHGGDVTRIVYEPQHEKPILVEARADAVTHRRLDAELDVTLQRSGWGLQVPASLEPMAGGSITAPHLLESSPFYARLEAPGPGLHAMSEVADFKRFHSPWIRWMANFRTRGAS
ncbi:MAG: carotenoid 1,2-hydratase [Myxococcota bacterium]